MLGQLEWAMSELIAYGHTWTSRGRPQVSLCRNYLAFPTSHDVLVALLYIFLLFTRQCFSIKYV